MKGKAKKTPPKHFRSKPHEGIDRNTVYVSNLSYLRDKAGVTELFIPYGEVVHVKVVIDKKTSRPTGMAFVEMKNARQADCAIAELDGQGIDGRILKAAPAIPMRGRPAVKAKDEAKPEKVEKLSKDCMTSKEAKAKRRKESGLGRLQQFLSTKNNRKK
ncbi:MAG: hypothetical protein A2X86_20305 [Bdellovibrionales bacterium GWA2_49_15]|nr:MAG: hypothetical protein A2X86_20305 [Bdellovibrionales bacterium GWA2_49_15]HAZ11343.1 hypothetical protein [Bdellovibrionales bacterium]